MLLTPLSRQLAASLLSTSKRRILTTPASVVSLPSNSAPTLSRLQVRALNTAMESLIFTNIIYWMVGYTRSAGQSLSIEHLSPGHFSTLLFQASYNAGTELQTGDCCMKLKPAKSAMLLSVNAGAYFTYLLVMFLLSLSMSALFRALGSISATTTHAQAYGSVGILILILTSGFAILRRKWVS